MSRRKRLLIQAIERTQGKAVHLPNLKEWDVDALETLYSML